MATPLTDAINALTQYANTVTGKTPPDTTLSDAVGTLAAGYGGGGYTADDVAQKAISGAITLETTTTIAERAFNKYNAITSITGALVTKINNYAFSECAGLVSATFSGTNLDLNSYTFQKCTNLTSVNVRTANRTNGYNFEYCAKLLNVALPYLSNSGSYSTGTGVFQFCTLLEKVDLGKTTKLDSFCLRDCTHLNTLVLRRTTGLTALSNINAFQNTPFASGGAGGTIYIPKVLYDHLGDGTALDYQSATNWSTIYGYGTITWAKIEGSQYESYSVDGLAI